MSDKQIIAKTGEEIAEFIKVLVKVLPVQAHTYIIKVFCDGQTC